VGYRLALRAAVWRAGHRPALRVVVCGAGWGLARKLLPSYLVAPAAVGSVG
jgi:hypothetical protein